VDSHPGDSEARTDPDADDCGDQGELESLIFVDQSVQQASP